MLISEMNFLRNHWYPVAVADDVRDAATPRSVRLFGDEFVLWAAGDEFVLADAFCPHRSARLSDGTVEDGCIVCPYHGWQFDDAGRCSRIPQQDVALPTPRRADLRTHLAQAHYGVVWACIGDAPVAARPPVWIEGEDEHDWRFSVEFFEEWNVSAPRIIDNNLDHSHVAFVHRSTFGDPDDALMPPVDIAATADGGFVSSVVSEQPGVSKQSGQTHDEAVRVERTAEVELLAPLTTRTRLRYGGTQPDYAFFGAATPIDDGRSIYMRLTGLAGTDEEQPWDTFHRFGTRVKEEDRVILESTADDFAVDIVSEVHLRSDRTTLEYRKYLMRLIDADPLAATLTTTTATLTTPRSV